VSNSPNKSDVALLKTYCLNKLEKNILKFVISFGTIMFLSKKKKYSQELLQPITLIN
jgi:hypothetical protein